MPSISNYGVPQLFQVFTIRYNAPFCISAWGEKALLAVGVAQICECKNCKFQSVVKY